MGELLQKQVDKLEGRVGKLEVLEAVTSVTSISVTAPITSTGGFTPTIGVSITPANPGGAVALQAATPGTQQTGNENISGKLITGGDVAAVGNVSGVNITGSGTVQGATVNATSKVQLNGVTVLQNGTSFPGSPATNQRFFRTDLGQEYYYDGTRWLSVQNYLLQLVPIPSTRTANSLTVTTANINYTVHPDNSSDIYVTSIITSAVVNTTNNGSNYWTTTFNFRSSAGGLTSYTGNTSAGTAGTITPITIAVNAVVTRANFTDVLQDFAKVGAPGTLFFDPSYVLCKLVAV